MKIPAGKRKTLYVAHLMSSSGDIVFVFWRSGRTLSAFQQIPEPVDLSALYECDDNEKLRNAKLPQDTFEVVHVYVTLA